MPDARMGGGHPDRTTAVSVAEVSRLVEMAVRGMPRDVVVHGALINISRGTTHTFATLRDRGAAVRVFIHSHVARRLEAIPTEGTGVILRASLSWYKARGEVQLSVRELWIADKGRARREGVARLRLDLERRGLLRSNRQVHLPRMPAAVVVVGGQGSAAVLDVVNAIHRRSPRTYIRFQPTRLQGAGAEQAIAAAIRAAAGLGAEVVAVVRGGGGADDFSPFDTREVCEAIAASPIPVITALGHEQDRTLADDAAHSSASTPADAARVLVADVVDLQRELLAARRRLFLAVGATNRRMIEGGDQARERLASALQAATVRGRLRLRAADLRTRLPALAADVDRQRRTVATLRERLVRAVQEKVAGRRRATRDHARILRRCMIARLHTEKQRFEALRTRLKLAEPDAVVGRGFVVARTIAGEAVTSAWDARELDAMDLQFADGTVRVLIRHNNNERGES
jgi:exodeoxyribonuclease VII large subunit